MRVAFVPQTLEAAGLLRCHGPLKALQDQYGWQPSLWPHTNRTGREAMLLDLTMRGLNRDAIYAVFNQETPPAEHVDVLLLHLPLNDYTRAIQWTRNQGGKVIVDCDDDYLHLPANHPARRGLDMKAAHHEVANLERAIRAADLVTVATPALAASYRRWNRNIHVIRNGLHWPMWDDQPRRPRSYRTVGYVGPLDYRRDDLRVLQGLIGPWIRRRPDWKFVSVGQDSTAVHDFLDIPDEQRVTVNWTEYGSEWPAVVSMIDIGLAPLARTRFNESKSHLKGMEHNAVGAPVIASPTESYEWWLAQGGWAHLATRPKEWERALDYLADQEPLDVAAAHATLVAYEWSIGKRAAEWYDVWGNVVT